MTDFCLATSEDGVRFKLKNDGTWVPDVEIQSQPVNTQNMVEGKRLFDLAEEYTDGSINVIKDEKRAFQLYKQSAELGYIMAFCRLAFCYRLGLGVKKDLNTALLWAKKAIKSGEIFGYWSAVLCFLDASMANEARAMFNECFCEYENEFLCDNQNTRSILSLFARCVINNEIPIDNIPSYIHLVMQRFLSDLNSRKNPLSELEEGRLEYIQKFVPMHQNGLI